MICLKVVSHPGARRTGNYCHSENEDLGGLRVEQELRIPLECIRNVLIPFSLPKGCICSKSNQESKGE